MKGTIIALLLLALASVLEARNIDAHSEALVEAINAKQDLWRAKHYPRFAGKSIEELKSYVGLVPPPLSLPRTPTPYEELPAAPDAFDSRTAWPDCVQPVRDQLKCGACWAFATAEALEDRFCIQLKNKVRLSPQSLVDCDFDEKGCVGGWIESSWYYARDFGVALESCYPYKGKDQSCRSICADGSQKQLYRASNTKFFTRLEDVKAEIAAKGPVSTYFSVYNDFFAYQSGIYYPVSGDYVGLHAVKIIGWGVENNISFWIAQNSWDDTWGENGYFRIKAGVCGFDQPSSIVAGDPRQ
eukprot:TRINITY_DN1514_c0_g1_i2.p1 TRINITY_DN1514_c0_g1~~TRINITY_DN1514_c0_g1_i2.p1  ORF type:complete len:299 (-),score=57.37 TRINITY_DN1514_c0_g1_i2:61-957(-)